MLLFDYVAAVFISIIDLFFISKVAKPPGGQGKDSLDRSAELSEDVPQCFSHFTYEATAKKRLVCDLQVPGTAPV